MKMGIVFRRLRALVEQSGTATPAEIASLDRLVAGGDQADVTAVGLEVAIRDTQAAMDNFMEALFDGLTEAESLEMLGDESVKSILCVRDQIVSLGKLTSL